jgi:dTDP-4-dehydrorhamnose reductase
MAKIDCKVNPITAQQYPTPAKRPRNTLMSADKIVGIFSVAAFNWAKSLQEHIKNIEGE